MLSNNPHINALTYENLAHKLSAMEGISIDESVIRIANMSFSQYHSLVEASADIPAPSGQQIGQPEQSQQTISPASNTKPKTMWPGKGAPVQQGMTVGVKDDNNKLVPGEVAQVDQSSKGVKVKNPITGQLEWYNDNDLQTAEMTNAVSEETVDINRLRHLAGIHENCSSGCTGAGSVAAAPASSGMIKRTKDLEESPSDEHPDASSKTIVGDTKPNQATGRLSANLAAAGKRTASRNKNGLRR